MSHGNTVCRDCYSLYPNVFNYLLHWQNWPVVMYLNVFNYLITTQPYTIQQILLDTGSSLMAEFVISTFLLVTWLVNIKFLVTVKVYT